MANETAKEKIPEELSLALVLTVYEAKGLEFDDVLLYNFFTDSEVFNSYPFPTFFLNSSFCTWSNWLSSRGRTPSHL